MQTRQVWELFQGLCKNWLWCGVKEIVGDKKERKEEKWKKNEKQKEK